VGSTKHPIGTPSGLSPNTGPLASAAWLVARGLLPNEPRWFVEIELAAMTAESGNTDDGAKAEARLFLEVYAEEWGYRFERDGRVSWIRVTDVPFVHGRDDHALLVKTTTLNGIGKLLRELEAAHRLAFKRDAAIVRSNVDDESGAIRAWLAEL
jgi:hypothetical protein